MHHGVCTSVSYVHTGLSHGFQWMSCKIMACVMLVCSCASCVCKCMYYVHLSVMYKCSYHVYVQACVTYIGVHNVYVSDMYGCVCHL